MIRKIGLAVFLLSSICFIGKTWAQQRYCDLKVTLLSPLENQEIAPYETFDVTIKIENLGPDSVHSGDTLLYNLPVFLLTDYHVFLFPQDIAPGDSAGLTLQSITNINENLNDEEANFCVIIKNSPFAPSQFVDSVISNNSDCHMVIFDATTGIQNINPAEKIFAIHPNPVDNVLHIQWKNPNGQMPKSISIRSVDGREISTIIPKNNQLQIQIPVAQLPSGLYFIDALTENGHFVQKFIKR